MAELPLPKEGILLTHFIVSDDVERSCRFYSEVLRDPDGHLISVGQTQLTG